MPEKSDTSGQPTLEKLEREGVSIRKCISYEGAGEYDGGKSSGASKAAKPKGALVSVPMSKGKGGY